MDLDLKTLRLALGLKQYQLADTLKVSQPTIAAIEKRRRSLTDRIHLQISNMLLLMPKNKRPEGWEEWVI